MHMRKVRFPSGMVFFARIPSLLESKKKQLVSQMSFQKTWRLTREGECWFSKALYCCAPLILSTDFSTASFKTRHAWKEYKNSIVATIILHIYFALQSSFNPYGRKPRSRFIFFLFRLSQQRRFNTSIIFLSSYFQVWYTATVTVEKHEYLKKVLHAIHYLML